MVAPLLILGGLGIAGTVAGFLFGGAGNQETSAALGGATFDPSLNVPVNNVSNQTTSNVTQFTDNSSQFTPQTTFNNIFGSSFGGGFNNSLAFAPKKEFTAPNFQNPVQPVTQAPQTPLTISAPQNQSTPVTSKTDQSGILLVAGAGIVAAALIFKD